MAWLFSTDQLAGRWTGTMFASSRRRSRRLDACCRPGARPEPTDDRPPPGCIRGHVWRADLVRSPAPRAAPQRRRRAADPGCRKHRGCGADIGAAARGGLASRKTGTVRVSTGSTARPAACRDRARKTPLPSGITLELVDELRQTANLVRRQPIWRCATSRRKMVGLLHLQGRDLRLCGLPRRDADAGGWITYTDEQGQYAPARWVQRQVEE